MVFEKNVYVVRIARKCFAMLTHNITFNIFDSHIFYLLYDAAVTINDRHDWAFKVDRQCWRVLQELLM